MNSNEHREAVELLQELGLKEYEAKSFVTLSRTPSATAKDISENTDVPRTRVYDATRVLEANGLVEIQHTNPQQFRAVPIEEAVDSLEQQYERRVEALRRALEGIEPIRGEEKTIAQEVWALGNSGAVASRTNKLIDEATEEIVMVIGSEGLLTEDLLDSLDAAANGVNVVIGAASEAAEQQIRAGVPKARVFGSGLEWLRGSAVDEGETAIGRLLLIDQETILLSTVEPESGKEMAVFGRGFGNGLVVITRRLMSTGLIPARDPGQL